MNLYTQIVLPHLLDWAMADPALVRYRQEILAEVEGEVLEIGFGTGLNLPYYPDRIQKITAIDANPGMSALVKNASRRLILPSIIAYSMVKTCL